MPYLLNLIYLLTIILLSPWILYKSLRTGKYRRGLVSKFFGGALLRTADAPCAWFHGVSVGEIHLLRQVVARFRERHPDWDCAISTTTDTGYSEACRWFADLPVFYWPFDFTWAVKRAIRRVNPSLIVLAESELWPNFLKIANDWGILVAVINGRVSPRSAPRYRRLGWLLRPLMKTLDLAAVQTEEYAACFRDLGVLPGRVHVTGSVKFDGVQTNRDNPRTQELRRLLSVQEDDLVWIAGSTQAPEEEIVLAIYPELKDRHPNLRLVLVPRQKDRFEEVAKLLEKWSRTDCQSVLRRRAFVRRSELNGPIQDRSAVVLVDTIGELGALWGLADIAYVGGSLDGKRGGQNMIEPAAYGAAVVFGPHVWNFKETARQLVEAGAALQVQDAAELQTSVARLVSQAEERAALGEAARRLVLSQQGATERTLDHIEHVLSFGFHKERAA